MSNRFDEFPSAEVDSSTKIQKYIVAEVKNPDGNSKIVIWAKEQNSRFLGHKDVLSLLKQYAPGKVDCIGGGYLRRSEDPKTITIGGDSEQFGPDSDRDRTVKLLSEAYPEYEVKTN